MHQPALDLSPPVSDEVRKTTCYMCACRCGIDVHMKGGQVAYIEGNRDHPVNRGVLCAKGSAGIMQHLARAAARAAEAGGPRGSGAFREISWDEALQTAVDWLKPLRETAPEKLAFFTGRDQSQSFTGWWAQASARRTGPRMAASVRSTWPRRASTRWAARSGNSASPTGTAPSCS
jgi:sulfite dehydrogenase (quinone) subunit SoeA